MKNTYIPQIRNKTSFDSSKTHRTAPAIKNEDKNEIRRPYKRTAEMPVKAEYTGKEKSPVGKKLKRKVRFAICIVIALSVLLIKLFLPGIFSDIRAELVSFINGDIDYVSAMEHIGSAVSGEEQFSDAIRDAYVAAFSMSEEDENEVFEEKDDIGSEITTEDDDTKPLPLEYWGPNDASSSAKEDSYADSVVSAFKEKQSEFSDASLPVNVSYDMPEISIQGICPVIGTVSSSFGYRVHPNDGQVRFHYGTDVAADLGSEILAFSDGKVIAAGESTGYGLYVLIEHENGIKTQYAHCSKLLVSAGDSVTKGDVIALVGESGNATGPCMHFELICDGVYVNPEYYVSWS